MSDERMGERRLITYHQKYTIVLLGIFQNLIKENSCNEKAECLNSIGSFECICGQEQRSASLVTLMTLFSLFADENNGVFHVLLASAIILFFSLNSESVK